MLSGNAVSAASASTSSAIGADGNAASSQPMFAVGDLVQICSDVERIKILQVLIMHIFNDIS